jgi:hypothetical protein
MPEHGREALPARTLRLVLLLPRNSGRITANRLLGIRF